MAAVAAAVVHRASRGVTVPTAMRCQVPGCTVNLTKLSDSYQRCRTCVEHSRAEHVEIDDTKFRFCQRCNKYQPLEEFEAAKRACREKLAIHNRRRVERRRKNAQQKDIASALVSGITKRPAPADDNQGTSIKVARPDGGALEQAAQPPEDPVVALKETAPNNQNFPPSGTSEGGAASGSSDAESQAISNRHTDIFSNVYPPSTDSYGIAYEGTASVRGFGASESNWHHPRLNCTDLAGNCTDLHPTDMGGAKQWPMRPDALFEMILELPPAPVAPTQQPIAPTPDQLFDMQTNMFHGAECGNTHFCIGPGCSHCATMGNTNFTCQATDLNMSAVRQGYLPERAAGYSHINQMPECHMSKFSMKLDRATPVDIPQDFMNRVRSMFEGHQDFDSTCEVMGYIRPGCLQVTVDVPVKKGTPHGSPDMQDRAVRALLDATLGWSKFNIDIALPGGRVKYSPTAGTTPGLPPTRGPELTMVQMATADNTVTAVVKNWQAYSGVFSVHCRLKGRYVPVNVVNAIPAGGDLFCLTLKLECAAIGLGWIEIVNGDPDHFYISEALPLLITDNADICEEVCQLTNSCHLMTRAEAVGVLKDLDSVLGFDERGAYSTAACARLAMVAARCGWTNTVQECIDLAGVDLEMAQMLDAWPELLRNSVQSGSLQTVAQVASCYVTAGRALPLAAHDALGYTPLHWAALVGTPEVIELLGRFDARGHAWHSVAALCAPCLTPAQTLLDPQASMRNTDNSAPPSAAEQTDAAPWGTAAAMTGTAQASPQVAMMLPSLAVSIVTACLCGGFSGQWAVATFAAALSEFGLRCFLPAGLDRARTSLLSSAPQLAGSFGNTAGRLEISDPALEEQYLSFWHSRLAMCDPVVIAAAGVRLTSHLMARKHPSVQWMVLAALWFALVAASRCISYQTAKHREQGNLGIQAICWIGYCLSKFCGAVDSDTPARGPIMALVGPTVTALLLAAQYSTLYPVRLRNREASMLINGVGAFVSALAGVALAGSATSLLRTLPHAVGPALFAGLGAAASCTIAEKRRLGDFFASMKKTA